MFAFEGLVEKRFDSEFDEVNLVSLVEGEVADQLGGQMLIAFVEDLDEFFDVVLMDDSFALGVNLIEFILFR